MIKFTVQIWIKEEKIKYLIEKQINVKILENEENTTLIELEINNNMDILNIFNAGTLYGLNDLQ